MTTRAAFQGYYSDLKFIKTRSVAQVVIEIPIESGDAFVQAFGTPNPASEVLVAIARMNPTPVAEEPKALAPPDRRSWDQLRPSQQAGIRCSEPAFQRYLREEYAAAWGHAAFDDALTTDAKRAAECVRNIFGIATRAELDSNFGKGQRWCDMLVDFDVWMGRA
jgi:hypothetical protein